jgi:hypothetical protein
MNPLETQRLINAVYDERASRFPATEADQVGR